MSEIKPGGPGPEDEESAASLPPDLEQERKEIEARIEQHVAKLQEIAEVFGIDTTKFSDEDDRKFAGEIERKAQLAKEWKSEHGIDRSPRIFLITGRAEIEMAEFPLGYENDQAGHINRVGHITDTGHINIVDDMVRGLRIFFTSSESQAIDYFKHMEKKDDLKLGDLHSDIEGDLMLLEIKAMAQTDEIVKHFIDWVRSRGTKSSDPKTFLVPYGNEFPDKVSQVEEHVASIEHSKQEQGFASNFRYKELSKAKMFAGRVITKVAGIYNQRMGYLMDLVHSGHPAFRKDEESSEEEIFYEIDPSFQFTEEDARKAAEMNLPWSRIEKEMEEESAKE